MLKCHFNKVASQNGQIHSNILSAFGCSPVNLLHIFRIPFPKNTSGGLLLKLSVIIVNCNKKQTN